VDNKIFAYLDNLSDAYNGSVEVISGLQVNQKEILRNIEFYSASKYLSGNTDELGREKPFYNVCNYRVTIAKIATDLDIKDIKFEPDTIDQKTVVATMMINRELFKYLKEINFSRTLNEMGHTRPKYGGVLIKKFEGGVGSKIEVVDWRNVETDPVEVLGGAIIETHYMKPSDVIKKSDTWYASEIDEAIEAHAKASKNKPTKMTIKEVTGEFPVSFDPNETDNEENSNDPNETDNEENSKTFKTMCFYMACVGKKKWLLYNEDIKDIKDKYRYLEWERIPGRGLGRGVIEDGFESQWAINDAMISMKNAMDIAGKVILATTSRKVSGNALTLQNGHIFELEDGKTINSLNLAPSALPQFERTIDLWNTQYNQASSTYDANTGESPTAGTPYSQTALLNQVANSPFEYRREEWGIFLNEILNDWIFPELKKRIMKQHYLVSEFGEDELKVIDEAINIKNQRQMMKEALLAGNLPTEGDVAGMGAEVSKSLSTFGSKREIDIPEKFLDIKGKISANITGELKNKSAVLQSLDSVLKTVVSSFNPNTGQYAVLEDPTLSKIFGSIVEMSGIPISSSMMKSSAVTASPTQPTPSTDLSAITPQPTQ